MTDLLPCPFCGNKAIDRRHIDGFPMIYCAADDCFGPQTTAKTFDDAVLQWNARAQFSTLAQPAVDNHYEDIEAAARAIFQVLSPGVRYTPQDSIWYRKAAEAAARCFAEVDEFAAQPPAAPVEMDAVRHAFRATDEIDWARLDQFIPQSGHGRFWKAVFAEVRAALSSDGEPSNGKQPLMASRPAPPVPSDPRSSADKDDDLVGQLRNASPWLGRLAVRAADEIERLRIVPQRSAATGGAEEAIRDWWYSRDRQPTTTSKEAAKSLIWYLAKCGLKIVPEPQPGDWINEPLRNWTATTDEPQPTPHPDDVVNFNGRLVTWAEIDDAIRKRNAALSRPEPS